MSLATRLKTTRKKHGLSQSELAKQVDVSQPTIANWERGGHIPRPDALARIASALRTDPAWLVSGEMPAQSNPAHQHLAKPVHHVPVYEWPVDSLDPTATQPVSYQAVAADFSDMFALQAHPSAGFEDGATLIFSQSVMTTPGRFLVREGSSFILSDQPSLNDDVFARLIYSVVPH
ncbi:hypothetical protein GCM10007853_11180 [Algimonas ampicilliniresistens]|uniref:HTH cro/C1-type domain-containing protein n=1 Tax=Algimonas ampicilliniresistens TaxID=1298735 RepID=A0ABQ5V8D9_9PROT|nr:helix-turn-helix domain-containing protein [Algimonas ampicilliniresistens]GLQ23244.1 hypothetical protein GCM10007853_11180 [Algimonas ampicilliniresistens]